VAVVLLAAVVVVLVSQPASERHSTDDLKLAMSDDARLRSPSPLSPPPDLRLGDTRNQ